VVRSLQLPRPVPGEQGAALRARRVRRGRRGLNRRNRQLDRELETAAARRERRITTGLLRGGRDDVEQRRRIERASEVAVLLERAGLTPALGVEVPAIVDAQDLDPAPVL